MTIPTPSPESTPVSARPPALANLSDAQLAQQLDQLVEEVKHRLNNGQGRRPELGAAVQRAKLSLDRLVPRPAKHAKRPSSSKTPLMLQERQHKAVRAALLAGVAPAPMAKHFGLSLASVRKVLEEAA